MYPQEKPLYSLTVGEFAELIKLLVNESLQEHREIKDADAKADDRKEFDIAELADFLRCSKVSIHKYKKKGLPFYRVGRKIIFIKQEVLEFMKRLKGKTKNI